MKRGRQEEAGEGVALGEIGYSISVLFHEGLAELAMKKYKSAAKYFLQASFDHCEYKEVL